MILCGFSGLKNTSYSAASLTSTEKKKSRTTWPIYVRFQWSVPWWKQKAFDMPINADGFFPTPDSLWRELLCWVPWWGGVVAPGKLQTLISEWPMYSVYIYIHVYPILRDTQNRGPRIFQSWFAQEGSALVAFLCSREKHAVDSCRELVGNKDSEFWFLIFGSFRCHNDLVAHGLSISGVYLNHEVLVYRSYVRTLSTWWPRCGSSRAFPVCHGMDKGSEPKRTALWVDIW